ncbi:hypothetical protein BJX96DRAFT_172499 [Aspergillus floccosus]
MPAEDFFDGFPDFELNPNVPVSEEFKRLARKRQWKRGSKTWKKMWNRFINLEYDHHFGDNKLAGLADWQELCEELDLEGPFTSIKQCRKAVSQVHVNIVDLLESRQLKHRNRGESRHIEHKPKKYPSVAALSRYTRETHRFFARAKAKQDKLLKVLLRRLV